MRKDILIPKELLQSEFAYVENETVLNKESASSSQDTPRTLIILDDKRWQNISIMLNKFPVKSYMEIHDAIQKMDDKKLNVDLIHLLSSFAPNSTEMEKLKPHVQDPPANLGNPEKFYLVLMKIPSIETRLILWEFKLSFKQKFTEIKEKEVQLSSACHELRNSDKFTSVLEIILYIGNFLNCNSSRGGAWGFKLDTLSRLAELKSKSNTETNMLCVLVEFIQNDYSELSDFYHDLKSVEKAKDIQQIASLLGDIQVLEERLISLTQFMDSPAADSGRFKEYMNPFIPKAQQSIKTLKDLYKTGCGDYNAIIEFFGETKGLPVGSFFEMIHRFLLAFENMKFKVSRKAALASRQNLGKVGLKMPSMMSQGTLDRVIAGLKSGQAFEEST